VLDYVMTLIGRLINIDFSGPTEPQLRKTGFAAVGQTSSDVWNVFNFGGSTTAHLTGVQWSTGEDAPLMVHVNNAPGALGVPYVHRRNVRRLRESILR
jgi:hypothetical protein